MAGEWLAQLPDNLKADTNLTSFATVGDLAGAHITNVGKLAELDGRVKESDGKVTDLTKRLEGALMLPGESATDAERIAFYTKLGRPESADKYEVGKPADWPADVPYNANDEKWFREVAMKHNLTTSQAKGLFADYLTQFKGAYVSQRDAVKAAETAAEKLHTEKMAAAVVGLKTDWPGNAYTENMALAARVADKFGLKEFLNETGIGNHVPLIKAFALIGKAMGEDFLRSGSGTPRTPSGQPGMVYKGMEHFK